LRDCRFFISRTMTDQPNHLRESLWRRKLSDAERAGLSVQPELELEARLTGALAKIPDAPVPSNFTARVLDAIELEEKQAVRSHGWALNWRRLWPRVAVAAAVLIFAGVSVQRHESHSRHARRWREASRWWRRTPSLPSVDALDNLDAIQRMSQAGPRGRRTAGRAAMSRVAPVRFSVMAAVFVVVTVHSAVGAQSAGANPKYLSAGRDQPAATASAGAIAGGVFSGNCSRMTPEERFEKALASRPPAARVRIHRQGGASMSRSARTSASCGCAPRNCAGTSRRCCARRRRSAPNGWRWCRKNLRGLVESRLQAVEHVLPPPLQEEFLANEKALHYFTHWSRRRTGPPARWSSRKSPEQFSQFFELTPAEKGRDAQHAVRRRTCPDGENLEVVRAVAAGAALHAASAITRNSPAWRPAERAEVFEERRELVQADALRNARPGAIWWQTSAHLATDAAGIWCRQI
jgi:hypothetical protein